MLIISKFYNIQILIHLQKCILILYFPYLQLDTNQCLKNCEIMSFIYKNCITDDLTEDKLLYTANGDNNHLLANLIEIDRDTTINKILSVSLLHIASTI